MYRVRIATAFLIFALAALFGASHSFAQTRIEIGAIANNMCVNGLNNKPLDFNCDYPNKDKDGNNCGRHAPCQGSQNLSGVGNVTVKGYCVASKDCHATCYMDAKGGCKSVMSEADIEKEINKQVNPDTTQQSGEDITKQIQEANAKNPPPPGPSTQPTNPTPTVSGTNNAEGINNSWSSAKPIDMYGGVGQPTGGGVNYSSELSGIAGGSQSGLGSAFGNNVFSGGSILGTAIEQGVWSTFSSSLENIINPDFGDLTNYGVPTSYNEAGQPYYDTSGASYNNNYSSGAQYTGFASPQQTPPTDGIPDDPQFARENTRVPAPESSGSPQAGGTFPAGSFGGAPAPNALNEGNFSGPATQVPTPSIQATPPFNSSIQIDTAFGNQPAQIFSQQPVVTNWEGDNTPLSFQAQTQGVPTPSAGNTITTPTDLATINSGAPIVATIGETNSSELPFSLRGGWVNGPGPSGETTPSNFGPLSYGDVSWVNGDKAHTDIGGEYAFLSPEGGGQGFVNFGPTPGQVAEQEKAVAENLANQNQTPEAAPKGPESAPSPEAPSPCSFSGFSASGCASKVADYVTNKVFSSPANAGEQQQTFDLTAYYPCANASACPIQGGAASSKPGLDGESVVRTLDDYRTGKSEFVTGASDPSRYGQTYEIPSVTYKSTVDGKEYTLENVPVYIHDTGGAFQGRPDKIDIAAGTANSDAQAAQYASGQPFLDQRYQTLAQTTDISARNVIPVEPAPPVQNLGSDASSPVAGDTRGTLAAGENLPAQNPRIAESTQGPLVENVRDINFAAYSPVHAVEQGAPLTDITPNYDAAIPKPEWNPQSGEDITAQIQAQNEAEANARSAQYAQAARDAAQQTPADNPANSSLTPEQLPINETPNPVVAVEKGGDLPPAQLTDAQYSEMLPKVESPGIELPTQKEVWAEMLKTNGTSLGSSEVPTPLPGNPTTEVTSSDLPPAAPEPVSQEKINEIIKYAGANPAESPTESVPTSQPINQYAGTQPLESGYTETAPNKYANSTPVESTYTDNSPAIGGPLDQKATDLNGTYQLGQAYVKADKDGVTFVDSNGVETFVPRDQLGNQTVGQIVAHAQAENVPTTPSEGTGVSPESPSTPGKQPMTDAEIAAQIPKPEPANPDVQKNIENAILKEGGQNATNLKVSIINDKADQILAAKNSDLQSYQEQLSNRFGDTNPCGSRPGGQACGQYISLKSEIGKTEYIIKQVQDNRAAFTDFAAGKSTSLSPELQKVWDDMGKGQGQASIQQYQTVQSWNDAGDKWKEIAQSGNGTAGYYIPYAVDKVVAGTIYSDAKVNEWFASRLGENNGYFASAQDTATCGLLGQTHCDIEAAGHAINEVGTIAGTTAIGKGVVGTFRTAATDFVEGSASNAGGSFSRASTGSFSADAQAMYNGAAKDVAAEASGSGALSDANAGIPTRAANPQPVTVPEAAPAQPSVRPNTPDANPGVAPANTDEYFSQLTKGGKDPLPAEQPATLKTGTGPEVPAETPQTPKTITQPDGSKIVYDESGRPSVQYAADGKVQRVYINQEAPAPKVTVPESPETVPGQLRDYNPTGPSPEITTARTGEPGPGAPAVNPPEPAGNVPTPTPTWTQKVADTYTNFTEKVSNGWNSITDWVSPPEPVQPTRLATNAEPNVLTPNGPSITPSVGPRPVAPGETAPSIQVNGGPKLAEAPVVNSPSITPAVNPSESQIGQLRDISQIKPTEVPSTAETVPHLGGQTRTPSTANPAGSEIPAQTQPVVSSAPPKSFVQRIQDYFSPKPETPTPTETFTQPTTPSVEPVQPIAVNSYKDLSAAAKDLKPGESTPVLYNGKGGEIRIPPEVQEATVNAKGDLVISADDAKRLNGTIVRDNPELASLRKTANDLKSGDITADDAAYRINQDIQTFQDRTGVKIQYVSDTRPVAEAPSLSPVSRNAAGNLDYTVADSNYASWNPENNTLYIRNAVRENPVDLADELNHEFGAITVAREFGTGSAGKDLIPKVAIDGHESGWLTNGAMGIDNYSNAVAKGIISPTRASEVDIGTGASTNVANEPRGAFNPDNPAAIAQETVAPGVAPTGSKAPWIWGPGVIGVGAGAYQVASLNGSASQTGLTAANPIFPPDDIFNPVSFQNNASGVDEAGMIAGANQNNASGVDENGFETAFSKSRSGTGSDYVSAKLNGSEVLVPTTQNVPLPPSNPLRQQQTQKVPDNTAKPAAQQPPAAAPNPGPGNTPSPSGPSGNSSSGLFGSVGKFLTSFAGSFLGGLLGQQQKPQQPQSQPAPVTTTPTPASTLPAPITTPVPTPTPTPTPTQKPAVTIVASPASVDAGKTATLTWAAIGPTACSVFDASGAQIGSGTPNGTLTTTAISTSTTYKITCSGGTGAANSQVTIGTK